MTRLPLTLTGTPAMVNLPEISSMTPVNAVYGKEIVMDCCGRGMKRTARMSRTQTHTLPSPTHSR